MVESWYSDTDAVGLLHEQNCYRRLMVTRKASQVRITAGDIKANLYVSLGHDDSLTAVLR